MIPGLLGSVVLSPVVLAESIPQLQIVKSGTALTVRQVDVAGTIQGTFNNTANTNSQFLGSGCVGCNTTINDVNNANNQLLTNVTFGLKQLDSATQTQQGLLTIDCFKNGTVIPTLPGVSAPTLGAVPALQAPIINTDGWKVPQIKF